MAPLRLGWLHTDSWAGRLTQRVMIVGETPTRYRIAPYGADRVRLAGRRRFLSSGQSALVPKSAVKVAR